MHVGYVVLYVTNPEACLKFWTEQVGMVKKDSKQAGPFEIVNVGFTDQRFGFQLVPLAIMADNPHGLDLATPSIAFSEEDLEAAREKLIAAGVQATEIGDQGGVTAFAFPDNEGRWFAVTKA
ncbi:MAG: VOC family protein [Micrococcales bacterium]